MITLGSKFFSWRWRAAKPSARSMSPGGFPMFAKINHLAICSTNYATNARFYQALFGMKAANTQRPARAAPVGDGQVGLNNIPLRDGRRSGLDHFGFEVESIPLAIERMKKFDPNLPAVERPAVRPNAAWSAADHDMIIYDLAERDSGKAQDIFAQNGGGELPQRYINHIALRATNPERSADFYATVYELALSNDSSDGNYRLSDGRVTLLIMPWRMDNFIGHDPEPPRLEHFGFKVESIAAVQRDMEDLIGSNPVMVTKPLGVGAEGKARLDVLKQCPIGQFQLTDLEGVHIDIND
jgi:catechol 2,3-dioxygenase-like lactoylglutathione lyase family enzyme